MFRKVFSRVLPRIYCTDQTFRHHDVTTAHSDWSLIYQVNVLPNKLVQQTSSKVAKFKKEKKEEPKPEQGAQPPRALTIPAAEQEIIDQRTRHAQAREEAEQPQWDAAMAVDEEEAPRQDDRGAKRKPEGEEEEESKKIKPEPKPKKEPRPKRKSKPNRK